MMALPLSDAVIERPDEIVSVRSFPGGVRVTRLSPWGATSSTVYPTAEVPPDIAAWSPAPAIAFVPFTLDLRDVKPLSANDEANLERRFLARAIELRGYRVTLVSQSPDDFDLLRGRILDLMANLGRGGNA